MSINPEVQDPMGPFLPKVGDVVIAKWIEDGVFYKAQILEFRDPEHCLLKFFRYGLGLSRYDELYESLSYLPCPCHIDQYLHQEVMDLLHAKEQERRRLDMLSLMKAMELGRPDQAGKGVPASGEEDRVLK